MQTSDGADPDDQTMFRPTSESESFDMLPNPLHPAIVHFPIVFAFLLPLFAGGAIWGIRRGANPRRAWLVPAAGAFALAASTWAAVETGEAQDERVERVVAERPLSAHEEMAETLLVSSAGLALVAALGLIGGNAGRVARVVTGLGSVALVVAAARVGHSGGELVYRYGAAAAYTTASTSDSARASVAGAVARLTDRRDGDDDLHR